MLTIELPTYTRDYVISIRNMRREDALTLSYLVTRLGADMLGAQSARRISRDDFTVCWSTSRPPDFDMPPDMIVTDECAPARVEHAAVLALGGGAAHMRAAESVAQTRADMAACEDGACAPSEMKRGTALAVKAEDGARLYTLGGRPYGTADYIASLCSCPAAYVALGALCRAMGFVPVQLAQRLLCMTVGHTEPHMLANCAEGAFRGYRQVNARRG